MWGGPYESTPGDKSSRSLTNHMIFRILYGFFLAFLTSLLFHMQHQEEASDGWDTRTSAVTVEGFCPRM